MITLNDKKKITTKHATNFLLIINKCRMNENDLLLYLFFFSRIKKIIVHPAIIFEL